MYLCNLLPPQGLDSLIVTSSSKADQSTLGLCIELYSCGMALNQYVSA